jgi:hypothetical protein
MAKQIDTACCTNGINYRATASRRSHSCALVLHSERSSQKQSEMWADIISGFISLYYYLADQRYCRWFFAIVKNYKACF